MSLFLSVFLVSLSTLAFEVLLTRVFAISQWNHLSFMVISIALFGFAASGTFLSIIGVIKKEQSKQLVSLPAVHTLLCLFSASMLLVLVGSRSIPLDYFKLSLEWLQIIYLLMTYLLLALPFFFSGLLVSMTYAFLPQKTGLVYFATMAGSACGAIIPAVVLSELGETRTILIVTGIPALFNLLHLLWTAIRRVRSLSSKPITWFVFLLANMGIIGLCFFYMTPRGLEHIRLKPSAYKAITHVLQFPDSQVKARHYGIHGRIDVVNSPYVRFAPGLSLKYKAELPGLTPIYTDGDNQLVLYHAKQSTDLQFARHMLQYLGYYYHDHPEHVLIFCNSGGSAIACALAAQAPYITIVDADPHVSEIVREHYGLTVINSSARAYLAGNPKKFDIIQIENWGFSIPGLGALTQEHSYTTEAFNSYLTHLKPEGLIIVARRLMLPPADSLRLWSTAYTALQQKGIRDPEKHLAVVRNWDTFTMIIAKQPLQNLLRLKQFAREHNFDGVYFNGLKPESANRFNKFSEPFHFQEIKRLAGSLRTGNQSEYFRNYLLDVRPQGDERPFPGRFLKWSKLKILYQTLGQRLYALLMSGEIVVSAVFIEALVVSVVLLILPLLLVSKQASGPPGVRLVYFFGVGAGFMFTELFFIKHFIILFENPTISFSIVIASILIFSSLGGLWVQRQQNNLSRVYLLSVCVVLLAAFFARHTLLQLLLPLSNFWRYFWGVLILAPIGFIMGTPFPLGMQYLLKNPAQRGYAWSVNGCASVLSSIASAQIALSLGLNYILGLSILFYFLALLTVLRRNDL